MATAKAMAMAMETKAMAMAMAMETKDMAMEGIIKAMVMGYRG